MGFGLLKFFPLGLRCQTDGATPFSLLLRERR